jgi:hypothetical protein
MREYGKHRIMMTDTNGASDHPSMGYMQYTTRLIDIQLTMRRLNLIMCAIKHYLGQTREGGEGKVGENKFC